MEVIDRTQCKECLYRSEGEMKHLHSCDYASLMGELRKCELSPNCTKFEPYDKEKRKQLRLMATLRNNQNTLCCRRVKKGWSK